MLQWHAVWWTNNVVHFKYTHALRNADVEVNERFFQLKLVEETIAAEVALPQLSTNASEDVDTSLWDLLSYNLCQTQSRMLFSNHYHVDQTWQLWNQKIFLSLMMALTLMFSDGGLR